MASGVLALHVSILQKGVILVVVVIGTPHRLSRPPVPQ